MIHPHQFPPSDSNMIYAIVGILVIAFIAFIIISAKAWHWSNIVFLCLCFLAGLASLVAMAQVLDARWKVMRAVVKSEEDLERVTKQIETTLYGDGFSFDYAPDSLRGLSEALSLEMAGRGRVWKNGSIEVDGDNRTFKFAGGDRELTDDNLGMQDMLLYVFSDEETEEGVFLPVYFVGTMKVVSETPGSLVLEPVFIANQQEYTEIAATWSLFEKPPADQRDAFIRDTEITLDVDDPKLNEKLTEYRTILTEEYMPADSFGFDLADADQARQYEWIIDRIMFDGLPIVTIESWIETQPDRVSPRFDPPNEEVFVKYRFDSDSTRSYTVDSDGNIETDGQFTQSGMAVDPALHADGDIEFKKDDEILVDQLTADGYQRGEDVVPAFSNNEPVTEIERVFVRQLSDFPYLLKTAKRQIEEYTSEIAQVEANNLRSEKAVEDAQNQSNERDEEIEQLLADQENFQRDSSLISQFADQTRIRKSDLEMKLKDLESQIKGSHRVLKGIVRAMLSNSGSTFAVPEAIPSGIVYPPAPSFQSPAPSFQPPSIQQTLPGVGGGPVESPIQPVLTPTPLIDSLSPGELR